MPVVKVGQASKADSTVAESIHEDDGVQAVPAATIDPIQLLLPSRILLPSTSKLVPLRTGFVTKVPLAYDIYGHGPVKMFAAQESCSL